ncbi:hypothetical protein [Luteimonas sp. TWI662]|uniref:hypothetical protein n=1 Tax=unclassified Luteimonas TaxID=2629088 RepID=UPI00320AA7FD
MQPAGARVRDDAAARAAPRGQTIRTLSSLMLGMLAATTVALGFEFLGKRLFPLPAGALPTDAGPTDLFAIAPTGMLLLVALGWLAGALCGGWVAARIARRRPMRMALTVGALILIAVLLNAWLLPQPVWMTLLDAIGALPLAWCGGRLAGAAPRR